MTTSQTKVIVSSWSGSGYILLDPATGAGAYMISGRAGGVDVTDVGETLTICGYMGGLLEAAGLNLAKANFIIAILTIFTDVIGVMSDCGS